MTPDVPVEDRLTGVGINLLRAIPEARSVIIILDDHVLDLNGGHGPIRVKKEDTRIRVTAEQARGAV